jgi:putative N-acetyltransferase (TIGR04045 family)
MRSLCASLESSLVDRPHADALPTSTSFIPCEFRIKRADGIWEIADARRLRRAVFCKEQGVFSGDDIDAIDTHAQPLVALSCVGGMADKVVGTVRIHRGIDRVDDAIWWGSRLAVDADFRKHGHIGATLIRLAVSSARAHGCSVFLAHVQSQNQPLFEKLHWKPLRNESLHGRPHVLMQADLSQYPPCHDALTGFVTVGVAAQRAPHAAANGSLA